MHTPWGTAQTQKTLGAGVVEVTTAGHGGIHLDAARNALVHPSWRNRGGWYEEDCDWAIVAVTFPNLFTPEHVIMAHRVAKNWHPDSYEKTFRVKLLPAESSQRREDLFYASVTDKLVTMAAFGAGQHTVGRVPVPAGMVGVVAQRGGRRGPRGSAEHWLLVPKPEYDTRPQFGFVIDEQRHAEWPLAGAEATA